MAKNKKSNPIDWNTTDLVTCVELNYTKPDAAAQADHGLPAPKEVYHFIYASQLYGTLFAVYGKFNVSPDFKLLYGVDLQLLNYEGLMNIGFCDVAPGDIQPGRKIEHLYLGVQGSSMSRSIYLPITDPKTGKQTSIPLTQGKHQRLKFLRMAYPLPGFKVTNKNRTDFNKLNNPKGVPIPDLAYFDTEFQYRSGTDYFDQILRPGMTGHKITSKLTSPRCTESNVNLIYY